MVSEFGGLGGKPLPKLPLSVPPDLSNVTMAIKTSLCHCNHVHLGQVYAAAFATCRFLKVSVTFRAQNQNLKNKNANKNKPALFVLLTDSFIIKSSKLLKPRT